MDKLRGRVRAGSRFSRDSYIPMRLADGMPGPIMSARVRGAATPLLPDKAPQTPETAESLLPLWPSPTVSFPGWEKGDKRKRTRRPQGPEWHPRLCLPLLSVQQHCLGGSTSLCSAQPSEGRGHSDFHGSRPSQQHFGLRRDTERTRLREMREEGRERVVRKRERERDGKVTEERGQME